jgi:hypothetical protein
MNRHHGGFTEHDAPPLDVNKRVGRAQVDGKVIGKFPQDEIE